MLKGLSSGLRTRRSKTPNHASSAHLVISRTGEITQLVSFNLIAWHAGFSFWEDFVSMNRYSIGIELDNDGVLKRDPTGEWAAGRADLSG